MRKATKETLQTMGARFCETRDKLSGLGYEFILSEHHPITGGDSSVTYLYIRPRDGAKTVIRAKCNAKLEVFDFDVYQEVSTSIMWNEYLTAIK